MTASTTSVPPTLEPVRFVEAEARMFHDDLEVVEV